LNTAAERNNDFSSKSAAPLGKMQILTSKRNIFIKEAVAKHLATAFSLSAWRRQGRNEKKHF
jgi:hypothetical protein